MSLEGFATRLIAWQREHGRHGLPWQGGSDPYRVWVSEIMLQQTQVATVLRYYPRFMARFPDVATLATASLDEVLAHWSGLGYYRRARLLHQGAQAVMAQWGGVFPRDAAGWQTLPGVGASTAAAVAAFCFGERVSILDGNVRRVLSRLAAWPHEVSGVASQRGLWALAQSLLPERSKDMVAFTQGLMDLGATVCTPTRPACERCPVASMCRGRLEGVPTRYPIVRRATARRAWALWCLQLTRQAQHPAAAAVWLQRRPASGVWAGLWCLPMFDDEESLRVALPQAWQARLQPLGTTLHTLTHRDMSLHRLGLVLPADEQGPTAWDGEFVTRDEALTRGLPAPLRPWLEARWPGEGGA